MHAAVGRSTFRSQNVQNTPFLDHVWKLRCRKSACRCGAKMCEAHFEVKMYKTHHVRTCSDHFWKLRCRKSARRCGAKHISRSKCTKHTILGPRLEVEMSKKCTPLWCEDVRSTFRSQNVQDPPCSDMFGPLLEVAMSKKCTPLWREAHFEVKSVKNWLGYGALLDVQMCFCVAGARDCGPCQK